MLAGRTWIRNHECGDGMVGNGDYMILVVHSASDIVFGDITNDGYYWIPTYPLCQITST